MHPAIKTSLVCPISKDKLVLSEDGKELISAKAKLAFPIRNGIPILLKEEARLLDDKE